MPKAKKTTYPEIKDIREDIDSLKSNIVELTKHIQVNAKTEVENIADTAMEQVDSLKGSSKAQYKRLEKQVKSKPGQSVAIAFAAGLAASLLLGRR